MSRRKFDLTYSEDGIIAKPYPDLTLTYRY